MTRSRLQKAATRARAAIDGMSYVQAFHATKDSPFSGRFASVLEYKDRHARGNPSEPKSEWERQAKYCLNADCRHSKGSFQTKRKRFWEQVFSFLPKHTVLELAGYEYVTVSYTQWLAEYGSSKPYTPVIFATFSYPDGMGYGDFVGLEDRISASLGDDIQVALCPVGEIIGYEEQQGTTGPQGFRVALMEADSTNYFSDNEWYQKLAAYKLFDSHLWNTKHSLVFDASTVTEPDSQRVITEIKFTADDSMTADELQTIADRVRVQSGAAWASAMEDGSVEIDDESSMASRRGYVVYFSNHQSADFSDEAYRFKKPAELVRRKLRFATSGEKKRVGGLPSVFSSDGTDPVGFSDCTVERNGDGIVVGYTNIAG